VGKTLFNEAERYLVGNWRQARMLEESMQEVRNKYFGLGQEVVERIREEQPALDWDEVYVHHKSGQGGICLARSTWPDKGGSKLGFYVERLRLEQLAGAEEDEQEPPYACIWTEPAGKTPSQGFEVAKRLTEEQRKKCKEQPGTPLWYFLPQTGEQLLQMLLAGDGQQFVECMVTHFGLLARFTPDLDEVCAKMQDKK
jgi:hypothetical protein